MRKLQKTIGFNVYKGKAKATEINGKLKKLEKDQIQIAMKSQTPSANVQQARFEQLKEPQVSRSRGV
jgi:hypothetical protein